MTQADRWRFVCPDCGSTCLTSRVTNHARAPFYCRNCKTPQEKRHDKKRGGLVS